MAFDSALKSLSKRVGLLIAFALFVGCGPARCGKRTDISPEEQLHGYISLAVNITMMEQREKLEDLTTGDEKDKLTSLSPEAFKVSYLDRRYDFQDFEIISKKETIPGKEIHLEYRVKFRTWISGEEQKRAPVQESRRLAIMKYSRGQWAIASSIPLDTDYKWDVGLPMDGVSTQGITADSPVVDPYADTAPAGEQEKPGTPEQGK